MNSRSVTANNNKTGKRDCRTYKTYYRHFLLKLYQYLQDRAKTAPAALQNEGYSDKDSVICEGVSSDNTDSAPSNRFLAEGLLFPRKTGIPKRIKMANYNVDGYIELHFNGDRTQVIANFYPPQGAGKNVSVQDVKDRLQRMNVVTGIREAEVEKTIHTITLFMNPIRDVVVAQGMLPKDGTDARIVWKVDEAIVSHPLPRRADGLPDYFAYRSCHLVTAGQPLAMVIPGQSGLPGRTLTPPYLQIPQKPGRSMNLTIGEGIRQSDDHLQYFAAVDGFLEHRSDHLTVTAFAWMDEDIVSVKREFFSGVLCQGSIHDSEIHAQGTVAVHGMVAATSLRSHSDIYIHRAEDSRLVADGNIFVLGALINCEVLAQGKVISLDGSAIIGGKITACQGVEARNIGTEDFATTQIVIASDEYSAMRLNELQEEMKAREATVQKISGALKPLLNTTDQRLQEQKNRLVQTLVEQRRELEARLRALHNQKRALMMLAKESGEVSVNVAGTIYPGVQIFTSRASMLVEFPQTQVSFLEATDGRSVLMRPLRALRAA